VGTDATILVSHCLETSAKPTSGGVLESGERLRIRLLFSAVTIACLLLSCAAAQSVPQQRVPNKHVIGKDPLAAQAVTPVLPLSPEQLPASPPQVAFDGGVLTIIANNSTLGDILRAVHRQTGAAVDAPSNATERVVGKFGPGPVRDVMTLLLNGSHFNYVVLGSATNPNALDRVMLISRVAGEEQPGQQANGAAHYQVPVATAQPAENADDEAADMTQESAEPGEDQTNQGQPEEQQPQPQPNPGQGGVVKTPEQLLQELQQRQQQMQQQQQQGVQPPFLPTPLGVPPQPPQPQP
jgi:hypothetical protein